MKNMRLLTALALALLAGCAQPLTSVPGSAGARLTVSVTAPQRALVPSLTGLTYDLTLTSPGQPSVVQNASASPTFTLPLLVNGTWTAQVNAKSGATVVASGTASKTLGPGDAATLVVPLMFTGAIVSGTGGVTLTVDASIGPSVAAASWSFTNPSGTTTTPSGTATFSPLNQTISYALTGMVAGAWTLNITFYADAQKTSPVAQVYETLFVLNSYTVYPPVILAAGDFNTPGKPQMVAISGGTFTYGTAQATVSPFLIGKFSVTQAQFQAVMGFNPSWFDNIAHANPEATWSPVEQVSMWDAMEYCNRLSRLEGLDPVYTLTGVTRSGNTITLATVATDLSRNGYRLPTDAEWEYAARAGSTSAFIWGGTSDSAGTYTWNSTNSASRTHGVGQKLPNTWGLYDMFGNVYQFINDWYDNIPTGPLFDYAGPVAAVQAPTTYSKISRGSSWVDSYTAGQNALAIRLFANGASANNTGFRIARRNGTMVNDTPVVGPVPHTLNSTGLYDGVGTLTHVAAALDPSGGWLVSGGTGHYGTGGDYSPQILFAKFFANGTQDTSFGSDGNGTVRPLGKRALSLGGAAGFDQNPTNYKVTLQGPYWTGSLRYNVLFQFDPNGTQAVSGAFPVGGGLQENVFLTDTDDGHYNDGTSFKNQFPVRDSADNLYSLARRPEGGGDWAGIQVLHPDGTVNQNFWTASYNGGLNINPQTLAIQSNDKVLVAGFRNNQAVIIRLNTDGTEDPSFGVSGRLWFAESDLASVGSLRFDASGRLYVAGIRRMVSGDPSDNRGVVYRLNANGTPDNTFGSSNGFALLGDPFRVPRDLALQANGKIVVVGDTSYDHTTPGFALRLLADGSALDTSFQGTGSVPFTQGFGGSARSVAIDSSGRIGVAGSVNQKTFIPEPVAGGSSDHRWFLTTPAFWVFESGSIPPPSVPRNFQLVTISATSAQLTWNSMPWVTYLPEYSSNGGSTWTSPGTVTTGSVVISGLSPATNYLFRVTAGGVATTANLAGTTQYSISYNLNGGINSGSNPSSFDTTTPTITFAAATRSGYVFEGWYSDVGLTISKPTIPIGSTGSVTVYAKWTAIVVVANRISGGGYHSLSIKADGGYWAFGYNYWGVFGNGTASPGVVPVQVAGTYLAVAAGQTHSLVVKADGTLMTSGRNASGELGNGTTSSESPNLTPFNVLTGVATVAAGGEHSLALKTNGDLYAFGRNNVGQLGDGTTANRSTPVLILNGVKAMAAGAYHSLALKTNGDLYAFGHNLYGQLGDNTTVDKSTPFVVMTGVSAIAAGWNHSLVLKTDGTLWTFGDNTYGQLGDGTTTQRNAPVQILSTVSVSTMAAGSGHSLVLKSDGTLLSFGRNDQGQLGNGATSGAANPTPYTVLTGVIEIAAGELHSLALKSDGQLMAFGQNDTGNQLGDGTSVDKSSPVQVSGSGW